MCGNEFAVFIIGNFLNFFWSFPLFIFCIFCLLLSSGRFISLSFFASVASRSGAARSWVFLSGAGADFSVSRSRCRMDFKSKEPTKKGPAPQHCFLQWEMPYSSPVIKATKSNHPEPFFGWSRSRTVLIMTCTAPLKLTTKKFCPKSRSR